MPLPAELLEGMAERSRAAETRARWDLRIDLTLTALACVAFSALGIALIGYALHTTDPWIGRIAFWSGLAVGNSGIIFTLLAAYRRGESRGDW
jgi:membrane associated rhomboid family serine protease